jgi:hypothetical protein
MMYRYKYIGCGWGIERCVFPNSIWHIHIIIFDDDDMGPDFFEVQEDFSKPVDQKESDVNVYLEPDPNPHSTIVRTHHPLQFPNY